MMADEHEHDDSLACVLAFDTDDDSFVNGFECGRTWQMLREDQDRSIEVMVHACNAEMLIRMAEATGRDVKSEEMGGVWIWVSFSEQVREGTQP